MSSRSRPSALPALRRHFECTPAKVGPELFDPCSYQQISYLSNVVENCENHGKPWKTQQCGQIGPLAIAWSLFQARVFVPRPSSFPFSAFAKASATAANMAGVTHPPTFRMYRICLQLAPTVASMPASAVPTNSPSMISLASGTSTSKSPQETLQELTTSYNVAGK